jgi:hypothetical protein
MGADRTLLSASAAFGWFLLECFTGLSGSPLGGILHCFSRTLGGFFSCLGGLFQFFCRGAHGAIGFPASATAGGRLAYLSAPGAGFGPSATAGGMGPGQGDPAGTEQTGHTESRQQFFHLFVHPCLLWSISGSINRPGRSIYRRL